MTCHQKIAGIWIQNGRMGKKIDGRTGKKRDCSLKKMPELGPKTGKIGKNGDFGAKKVGWGSGEKTGFTTDFAML